MRYVILRDDDTNALTPPECLERLYRPFLDRRLPVNLAVIPAVRTTVTMPDGRPEGFLVRKTGRVPEVLPLGHNRKLVEYLAGNPGYHLAQHGCHHDYFEFDRLERPEIPRRLEQGTRCLEEAGFPPPDTFIAPHDKLSRRSLKEVARRFRVLSTGWFELRRLPPAWWPGYCLKKLRRAPHWRAGRTILLTHPGCLLSCHRPYEHMLDSLKTSIASRTLTVLVTHWWEYFRSHKPDEPFIAILHQAADYLAGHRDDIRVVTFAELAAGNVPLN